MNTKLNQIILNLYIIYVHLGQNILTSSIGNSNILNVSNISNISNVSNISNSSNTFTGNITSKTSAELIREAYYISYLQNPWTYAEEICSYRGSLQFVNETFDCNCRKEYTSLNYTYIEEKFSYSEYNYLIITTRKKINGVNILCDYKRKRTFVTFFLLLFFPLGSHLIYLEHWSWGIICLMINLTILIGNAFRLIQTDNQTKYLDNTLNLVLFIFGIISVVAWTGFVIHILYTGTMFDRYGINTVNDLGRLNHYFK